MELVNMRNLITFIFLVFSFTLRFSVVSAQNTQPDNIVVDTHTTVNFMKLELQNVQATDSGVSATITLENPGLSLFLDYEIYDPYNSLTPATPATEIWGQLGLIPPNELFDIIRSEPDIQYEVTFTNTSQSLVLITSQTFGGKSLTFNALIVSINALLVANPVSPTDIARQLVLIPEGIDRLITLGENINCFAGDPPTLDNIDNCLVGLDELFNNPLFKALVRDVAARLGRQVTAETIEAALNNFSLLQNIADGVAFSLHLAFQSGSIVNQYGLRPITLDPDLLPPWTPRLTAPQGSINNLQPSFQWERAGGADYYNLQVSNNPDYISPLIDVTVTGSVFDSPLVLEPSTSYYWHVRSVNEAGVSTWSNGQFTTSATTDVDTHLEFGPETIWNFPDEYIEQLWTCSRSEIMIVDCAVNAMETLGAPSQAIAFTSLLENEAALMLEFNEMGRVDIAEIFYPLRINSNGANVLVNGTPRVVYVENIHDIDITGDPLYAEFAQRAPRLAVFGTAFRFEAMEQLPEGGQRFIYLYGVLECRACETIGYAIIAFDFDSQGRFVGKQFLGLSTEQSIYDEYEFTSAATVPNFSNDYRGQIQECDQFQDPAIYLDCYLMAMGASTEAREFTRVSTAYLDIPAVLESIEEMGQVDFARVVYPLRINTNYSSVLINGSPSIIDIEDIYDVDISHDPLYSIFMQINPNLRPFGMVRGSMVMDQSPLGGQRIIFSYGLTDCRMCEVAGYAWIAFDFDSTGRFVEKQFLYLTYDDVPLTAQQPLTQDCTAYSPAIAAASMDGNIVLFDPVSGVNNILATVSGEQITWPQQVTWSPNGQEIAFVQPYFRGMDMFDTELEYVALMLLNLSDGSQRELARSSTHYTNLAWSSDSTWLAYVQLNEGRFDGDLYVINTSNGVSQFLVHGSEQPDWSPDGQLIAYNDGNNIYTTNLDGSEIRQITNGTDRYSSPDWSPDGTQLVFVGSPPDSAARGDIFAIDANGANLRQLTHNLDFYSTPKWSPDGNQIAYALESGVGTGGVYLLNPQDGTITDLPEAPEAFMLADLQLSWSPDGTKIAYWDYQSEEMGSISVINIDNQTIQQQTLIGIATAPPAWAPCRIQNPNALDTNSSPDTLSARPTVIPQALCPNTPLSRLTVGNRAGVTFTDGSPTRLRTGPGTNNAVLLEMPEGTHFTVLSGPECGTYAWWQVQLDDGTTGWAAEGNYDIYFVEPVN